MTREQLLSRFEGRAAITPDCLWQSGLVPLGRWSIFAGCREFIATSGQRGIPCRRVGRRLVIPLAALADWLGFTEAETG